MIIQCDQAKEDVPRRGELCIEDRGEHLSTCCELLNVQPLLTRNIHRPSLSSSTPGLHQPRSHHLPSRHHPHHHHHPHGSRGSTLSSAASQILPPKSISDGNMTNTAKAHDISSVASSAALDSQKSVEEISDAGSSSTVEAPTFVRLAPYFESIPNRKYASLSRIRQQKCVNLATDPSIQSLHSMDDLRLNGILSQTILEDREPITELVCSSEALCCYLKPLLTRNIHRPSLSSSTPGLHQPRSHHLPSRHHPHHHHHPHGSRGSTLSSAASQILPPKSISDGNMTNTAKAHDISSVASSAALDSQKSVEEISDAGSSSTVEAPTFVRLAPYFESIPNRKYASLSRIRQQKCVNLATDPSIQSLHSMDDLRLNGILSQTILEDREPITELKQDTNYVPLQTSTPKKENPENQLETSKSNAIPKYTAAIASSDNADDSGVSSPNPCRILSRLWRYALVTGGLSLLIIVLGTTLATEIGYQGPVVMRIRRTHLFANWEAYCYHPLRSLLLGTFQ
nr:hypothetical transcript [Hymenolepis microstoma]